MASPRAKALEDIIGAFDRAEREGYTTDEASEPGHDAAVVHESAETPAEEASEKQHEHDYPAGAKFCPECGVGISGEPGAQLQSHAEGPEMVKGIFGGEPEKIEDPYAAHRPPSFGRGEQPAESAQPAPRAAPAKGATNSGPPGHAIPGEHTVERRSSATGKAPRHRVVG